MSGSATQTGRGCRPQLPAAITAIVITLHTPALGAGAPSRTRYTPAIPRPPQPPTRRQLITAIMTSQPPRAWSGHELAQLLHVKPRNMLTQLGEWARLGFFTRTDSPGPTSAPMHSTRQHPGRARQTGQILTSRHCVRQCSAPPLSVIFHGKSRHLSEGRGLNEVSQPLSVP
jgi:hypothetical protein